MMNATNGHRPTPTEPEALRAEIAQTRLELGETVSALAAKVDVKARAQEVRNQLTARAKDTAGEVRGRADQLVHRASGRLGTGLQWPMLGAVAALTLLVIGLATRRRRG